MQRMILSDGNLLETTTSKKSADAELESLLPPDISRIPCLEKLWTISLCSPRTSLAPSMLSPC